MKAYVCRRYGGPEVVQLEELPDPTPRYDEILVRIHATSVTAADWRVRTLAVPPGLGLFARLALGVARPRQPILGTELAGVVEATGRDVTRYRAGDAVMAFPGSKMGCHAELRALPESGPVAAKPAKLSFEEAASLPFGAATALDFLRKARVRAGEELLVVGASGGVGTAVVQLARHLGARVTGVTSARNVDLVRSLGADDVVDYTREDVASRGARYDVVVDTVGDMSFPRCKPLLREGGRFVPVAGGLPELWAATRTRFSRGRRVIAAVAEERPELVAEVAELAASGALRPVIDRIHPFDEMREAHAYVETRRKRGSVVVRVLP